MGTTAPEQPGRVSIVNYAGEHYQPIDFPPSLRNSPFICRRCGALVASEQWALDAHDTQHAAVDYAASTARNLA